MRLAGHIFLCCGVLVLAAATVEAAPIYSISGNFCSEAQVQDASAGVVPVPATGWNDWTSPAGFGPAGSATPKYHDGTTAVGTTIQWATSSGGSQNTNDQVVRALPPATLGNHIDDGHDQMMAGYLQASRHSNSEPVIWLRATGLNVSQLGGSYSLIVYFDGDDDVANDVSRAQIRLYNSESDFINSLPPLTTVYTRDTKNTNYSVTNNGSNPLSVYKQITSTNEFSPTLGGNYFRFDGLTGSEFYLRMAGVASNFNFAAGHGVALNGFQIVPEPGMIGLLAAAGMLLCRRR